MKKTITKYYCNECGRECDQLKDFVVYDEKGSMDGVGQLFVKFGTTGVDGKDYCLCDDCKRNALVKALDVLEKEHSHE